MTELRTAKGRQKLVERFYQSGQTVNEFVKSHSLNYSTFYGWIEKQKSFDARIAESERKAAEVVRLFEFGLSVEAITKSLKMARITVTDVLAKADKIASKPVIEKNHADLTEHKKIEILRAMCRRKLTKQQTAKEFNVPISLVESWVKEAEFYGHIRRVNTVAETMRICGKVGE